MGSRARSVPPLLDAVGQVCRVIEFKQPDAPLTDFYDGERRVVELERRATLNRQFQQMRQIDTQRPAVADDGHRLVRVMKHDLVA